LLVAIEDPQLASIYAMQEELGLAWGVLRPALVRMEVEGLIERKERGRHGRRSYGLTVAGREEVDTAWKSCLDPQADTETILRGAWVASIKDTDTAVGFLMSAADRREEESRARARAAESLRESISATGPRYRWARLLCQSEVMIAEASAFRKIAEAILERRKNLDGREAPR